MVIIISAVILLLMIAAPVLIIYVVAKSFVGTRHLAGRNIRYDISSPEYREWYEYNRERNWYIDYVE